MANIGKLKVTNISEQQVAAATQLLDSMLQQAVILARIYEKFLDRLTKKEAKPFSKLIVLSEDSSKWTVEEAREISTVLETISKDERFSDMLSNHSRCAECRGACCNGMGCEIFPWDIEGEITYESLKSLIDKGYVSIDYYEADNEDDRVPFLRSRHVDAPISDPAWEGRCMHLRMNGCELPFDKRPSGSKFLVVDDELKSCRSITNKKGVAICWLPYKEILWDLYNYYQH